MAPNPKIRFPSYATLKQLHDCAQGDLVLTQGVSAQEIGLVVKQQDPDSRNQIIGLSGTKAGQLVSLLSIELDATVVYFGSRYLFEPIFSGKCRFRKDIQLAPDPCLVVSMPIGKDAEQAWSIRCHSDQKTVKYFDLQDMTFRGAPGGYVVAFCEWRLWLDADGEDFKETLIIGRPLPDLNDGTIPVSGPSTGAE